MVFVCAWERHSFHCLSRFFVIERGVVKRGRDSSCVCVCVCNVMIVTPKTFLQLEFHSESESDTAAGKL